MLDVERLCEEQGIPIEQLSEILVLFGEAVGEMEEDQCQQ